MLRVVDLTTGYGPANVLHGVNLEVRKGECVALLGNNGAGKSTTLKAITGLLPVRGGFIEAMGTDITNLRSDQVVQRGIALVPEGRRLFPRLTVRENLTLGAYLIASRTEFRDAFERALQMFPLLGERLDQLAGTLSGGEQQMVAIARALMLSPKILLLDEPSMGLAPQVVDFVFEVIRDIHASGTTILLVEQNANRALEISDRAYVLENGKIALKGSSAELNNSDVVRKAYLGH